LTTWKNLNREDVARFKPFKLTFHMQTPIMLAHPWLALDGILAHLINREVRGEDYYTLPSKEPVSVSHGARNLMPLLKTVDLAHYLHFYHASVAQLEPSEASAATIYKRFDESRSHLIQTEKKKIDVSRGLFRAYAMRMAYVPARTATFYGYGFVMEVLRLISHLPGLGKKVAYGYGMFRSVSVEETAEDYSFVKDGVAMRPLPSVLFRSDENMMLAFKPPYWDKTNVRSCVPPGAKVLE
jgi:CRISPR type IV-associated protein Csf3